MHLPGDAIVSITIGLIKHHTALQILPKMRTEIILKESNYRQEEET